MYEFYEDMAIGEPILVGTYRFTAESITGFARRYDPQPFHLTEAAARQSHFGHLCASGWQTAAAWMNCNLRKLESMRATEQPRRGRWPEIGVSPGFEQLRWSKPVYVDDEVTYTMSVVDKRELKSRPEWGMITFAIEGRNQDGVPVISFRSKVLVQKVET
ncbi:acyl dehydratase [Rhodoligotrophos appendicifer]|uniref:MaoC family dehydratase n=1 Tax=Rhodoligotrophos appendicifer TaxID=987056 RepID=UPI0011851498|nr:MaoC family dehydratase [Rhodoligotrophos appendicifer]